MAIGVFDSGIGGLSVHRRLVERFPRADFVYLADQANTPYGGRSGEEIVDLTRAGCERLFAQGCDLVILACNTASAIALRRLQQTWLPGVRAARALALSPPEADDAVALLLAQAEARALRGAVAEAQAAWDRAAALAGQDWREQLRRVGGLVGRELV